MNVRLAAQTECFCFSCIQVCNYASSVGCKGLDDCKGTADFVSIIDCMFDIFNSRGAFAQGYKSPNRKEIFLEDVEESENWQVKN